MHSMSHPAIGTRIARQMVDERVRDAEVRRVAHKVRRDARAFTATPTERRRWRIWPRPVHTPHPTGGA
jgi:hypothetical protein